MREQAIAGPARARTRVLVGLGILILVIALVLLTRTPPVRAGIAALFAPSAAEVIDRNLYQAVFIAGGQVFFGKLQPQGDDYFLLNDVFYLAVPEQGGQGTLVKRGTELHAPREPMIIPAREILFIENLRDDGTVAKAIAQFHAGTLPTTTAPPITTAPPATAAPVASGTPRPSPSPTR